ncbi:hypothetical protein AQUCO_06300008v1 [Aquilegia coerulea]|uniref:Uncharacterized protein n=1 Tax=Aquilegia coerulea TaxID=218851 RepID=A0A2G5CCP1_AQUCA|nr:hypothetical protein AQUCO_06300008v1 [Aquilegia coerulea]
MDLVSPIIDIVSRVMDCSTRHVNYLHGLEEKLNQLKEKMDQLNEIKSDVNNKVIAAEEQLMVRTNEVNGWMQRVEARGHKVEEILLEGTQHLERSYKLGKTVVKSLILVEELKRNGVFEAFAESPPVPLTQELPVTPTVGLDSIFERAWNFLGENSVRIMGLYGMGGVGKTTLLKKINNDSSNFDIVMWVVISKEVNMARVQKEIGKKLGLSLPDANNIYNVLKKKKFLLLLDDVWQRIDLLSIGVPSFSSQNKSKILFTTRSEAVCGRMEADTIIRVECLNWEAAWTLFQEKVGYIALNSDSDIPKLAEIVADECRGLPLALVTIGRSMASKKTRQQWEHAISVLRNSAAEFPGMGDDVLPLLKFSYDSLPNDTVRLCFLFCSLYPEDYSIKILKLIEQWVGEGYIGGYDNFKEALNTGRDIIGILKGVCLLEEGDAPHFQLDLDYFSDGFVKMHDVVRDLALWIASECGREKEKYFVKAGFGLIEAPKTGKWPTMAKNISLFGNDIIQLENISKCPNVSTLLVSHNERLNLIHNDFFLAMPALRFLDLSDTSIQSLPASIFELFDLEFLDLSYTKIRSLPYEMRNFTKLKYLSLRWSSHCKIPRGIIMNLSNLEFLKIDVYKQWNPEGSFEIDELICLKQLKSLEIRIYSNITDIEKVSQLLRVYQLCKEFGKLHYVNLGGCHAIVDLSWLLLIPNLQTLWIWECGSLQEILSSSDKSGGAYDQNTFTNLKFLRLYELPNLLSICSMSALPFPSLETVVVLNCPNLKRLPLDSNSANNTLKKIEGEAEWWNGLEWANETIKIHFASFLRRPYS